MTHAEKERALAAAAIELERQEVILQMRDSANSVFDACRRREAETMTGPNLVHVIALDDSPFEGLAELLIIRIGRQGGQRETLRLYQRFVRRGVLKSKLALARYLGTVGTLGEHRFNRRSVRLEHQDRAISEIPPDGFCQTEAPYFNLLMRRHKKGVQGSQQRGAPSVDLSKLKKAANLLSDAALWLRPGSNAEIGVFILN